MGDGRQAGPWVPPPGAPSRAAAQPATDPPAGNAWRDFGSGLGLGFALGGLTLAAAAHSGAGLLLGLLGCLLIGARIVQAEGWHAVLRRLSRPVPLATLALVLGAQGVLWLRPAPQGLPPALVFVPLVFLIHVFVTTAAARRWRGVYPRVRRGLMFTGHLLLGGGMLWAVGAPGQLRVPLVLATLGLVCLGLPAHWTRRAHAGAPRGSVYVPACLTLALLAALLNHDLGARQGNETTPFAWATLAGGMLALAAIAEPPRPQRVAGHTPLAAVALHAVLLGLSLYVFLHLLRAWAPILGAFVVAVVTAWMVSVLAWDAAYLLEARDRRRKSAATAPSRGTQPVTVLVTAGDRADLLDRSLQTNLALEYPLRFLVVASDGEPGSAFRMAERYAQDRPQRLQVVHGEATPGAGDLERAWDLVETDLVVLLDADETVDVVGLHHAVEAMEQDPRLGLVQGRRVVGASNPGAFARLVASQRRYAGLLEQPFHAGRLGAGSWRGSGALVRRQVPRDVGGFFDLLGTDGAEISLRLHLDTPWRVGYEDRFVVRSDAPGSLREVLARRISHARAWARCASRYVGTVFAAREELKGGRTVSLLWQLASVAAAPLALLILASMAFGLAGFPSLPLWTAAMLLLFVVPVRALAYVWAAAHDPFGSRPRGLVRRAEVFLHGYVWTIMDWFLGLHALYRELAAVPAIPKGPSLRRRAQQTASLAEGAPIQPT